MPYSLMMAVAGVLTGVAYLTGWPTPITPGYVKRYHHNWSVSIRKAERELGYRPMGFDEALGRTIEWIKDQEKRT
jgi:nucleoside-diphosphate-sugar epimerase